MSRVRIQDLNIRLNQDYNEQKINQTPYHKLRNVKFASNIISWNTEPKLTYVDE